MEKMDIRKNITYITFGCEGEGSCYKGNSHAISGNSTEVKVKWRLA